MIGWLNLALGLVQIVNHIITRLDEAQKHKVWAEVQKTELGRISREEINKAIAARLAVDVSPERLRDPSPDSIT